MCAIEECKFRKKVNSPFSLENEFQLPWMTGIWRSKANSKGQEKSIGVTKVRCGQILVGWQDIGHNGIFHIFK